MNKDISEYFFVSKIDVQGGGVGLQSTAHVNRQILVHRSLSTAFIENRNAVNGEIEVININLHNALFVKFTPLKAPEEDKVEVKQEVPEVNQDTGS